MVKNGDFWSKPVFLGFGIGAITPTLWEDKDDKDDHDQGDNNVDNLNQDNHNKHNI